MTHPIIQELEKAQLKAKAPEFRIGDTVEVRTKVKEGDKERVSLFVGTVIGRQGVGIRETFTVRRLVQGEGVERVIPIHSPMLVDVKVRHKGEVRRAKLYYLRKRVGKATRVKGRTVHEVAGDGLPPVDVAQAEEAAKAKAESAPAAKSEAVPKAQATKPKSEAPATPPKA
jgi:large subunit ribosomal protein L19